MTKSSSPPKGTFHKAAAAHYAALGLRIQRVLTDNSSSYCFRLFDQTCYALGITHSFTRPYWPQTNSNAERITWLPAFLAYYNPR